VIEHAAVLATGLIEAQPASENSSDFLRGIILLVPQGTYIWVSQPPAPSTGGTGGVLASLW
jgi:hypothetical protein